MLPKRILIPLVAAFSCILGGLPVTAGAAVSSTAPAINVTSGTTQPTVLNGKRFSTLTQRAATVGAPSGVTQLVDGNLGVTQVAGNPRRVLVRPKTLVSSYQGPTLLLTAQNTPPNASSTAYGMQLDFGVGVTAIRFSVLPTVAALGKTLVVVAKNATGTLGTTKRFTFARSGSVSKKWVVIGVPTSLGSVSLTTSYAASLGDWGVIRATQAADYVALGDSYASGEGSFSYQADQNICHRATNGYAVQLAAARHLRLQFGACSGAVTRDLFSQNSTGNSTEAYQERLLGPWTKLVTISVGGNDLGFGDVMSDCIKAYLSTCQADTQTDFPRVLDQLLSDTPSSAVDYPNSSDHHVIVHGQSLRMIYEMVALAAPNAKIYVLGYPHLVVNFDNPGTCSFFLGIRTGCDTAPVQVCRINCGSILSNWYLYASDCTYMNWATDQADSAISAAVAGLNNSRLRFLDLRVPLSGHEIGSSSEGVNGLDFTSEHSIDAAAESFHPNTFGQNLIAAYLLTHATL